jgi:hypothetical protein
MPEERHQIMGWCHFRNYRNIIDASKDRHLIDSSEFLISLGLYTTIPKAPRGKAIDQTLSHYLDIVHIDIAFGVAHQLEVTHTLSFLLTAPHNIIGRSDSNLSNTRTSLQHSLRSMTKQGHLHANSAVIVMRNFLVAAFDPSSIPTNPPLN